MKLKRLVLGSSNPAKLKEWSRLLDNHLKIVSIKELEDIPDPFELGETFEENARLKAAYYAKRIKEYVLSEDGGYEVDALGGAPGVKSRRILPGDKEGTDKELIDYILGKLKGVPQKERTVRLTTAVVVSDPIGNIIFEDKGSFSGVVTEKVGPVLIQGYPFRSIHFIPELGKTYAELTEKEHNKYNHKRKIADKLTKFLLEYK
jgi:XTP/dITP diphosphohydrolase